MHAATEAPAPRLKKVLLVNKNRVPGCTREYQLREKP
jgi:hypothetical protein